METAIKLTSVRALLLALLRLLGCMPGDFIGLEGASDAVKEPGVVGRDPGDAGRPRLGCIASPPCNNLIKVLSLNLTA